MILSLGFIAFVTVLHIVGKVSLQTLLLVLRMLATLA